LLLLLLLMLLLPALLPTLSRAVSLLGGAGKQSAPLRRYAEYEAISANPGKRMCPGPA
jgi:hypothetical protein